KGKAAAVHYQFVIGTPTEAAPIVEAVIQGEAKRLASDGAANEPRTTLDLEADFAPFKPVLVHSRPVTPTPDRPDVGPFFDDPLDQENDSLPAHYTAPMETFGLRLH